MPQSCCGAVSHWSDPTTARAVPIVHSIAQLRVCTDRGPGEHFDTRSKPRSRSAGASPGECPSTHETGVKCAASSRAERWVTALQSGERSLVSRILQRVPSGERKWQCARAARRSVARARGRADRRARSADGKARSAPVRSPWMRSQPQHYTACVGTCPAPGIVSPSSGRSANRAPGHRNAICRQQGPKPRPALQRPPFEAWAGCDANLEAADQALNRRVRVNAAASVGKSSDETESATSSTGDPPQRHDWSDD
jgi:hypothetical protein